MHKTAVSLLLCFVGHHDKAYQWAERRKLETHPKTGAAQLVEIRERVEEIAVPRYIEFEQPMPVRPAPAKPILFAHISEDELLGYGVPAEWLADVRAANEDTLLDLTDHLPAEAAEALLELATGGRPRTPDATIVVVPPAVDYLDISYDFSRRRSEALDLPNGTRSPACSIYQSIRAPSVIESADVFPLARRSAISRSMRSPHV